MVLGHRQDLLGCIAYYKLMKHILALIQNGTCRTFKEALQQPVPKDCDIVGIYQEGRRPNARLVGNAKHELHLNVQDGEPAAPRVVYRRNDELRLLSKHQHNAAVAFAQASLERVDMGVAGVSLLVCAIGI